MSTRHRLSARTPARADDRGVTRIDSVAIGRGVLAITADRGSRSREALALQRLAGNQAMQRAMVDGGVAIGNGSCSTDELQCTARANRTYDSATNAGKTKKAKDAEGNVVYTGAATASATFRTTVDIHLAKVPEDASACVKKKLQTLIDKKLKPHELDHKQRFLTTSPKHSYVGSWSKKVTAASDDKATAESEAMAKAQTAIDDEAAKRTERNDDYAINAIDPFSVTADISDCPECQGESSE